MQNEKGRGNMNGDTIVDENHVAWDPQQDWKIWSPKEWPLPITISPTPVKWNCASR